MLVFHDATEPFDKYVVQRAAKAVHADAHVPGQQRTREFGARERAALFRVEDDRTGTFQGPFQRVPAEASPGVLDNSHVAAEPVHDGHEVHEAAPHGDVRDVGAPYRVRHGDYEIAQKIRIDRVPRGRPSSWTARSGPVTQFEFGATEADRGLHLTAFHRAVRAGEFIGDSDVSKPIEIQLLPGEPATDTEPTEAESN